MRGFHSVCPRARCVNMRRMHGVLLIVLLFTSVSAYQGVGNLPLRLHFSLARVSRAPRSRVLPAFHSLKAATALVAAENKKHNGFMHVECPDRVGVMWDSFVKSGMCAVSFFLHTFASRLWHMAISAPMMSVAVNRDRRRLHGPKPESRRRKSCGLCIRKSTSRRCYPVSQSEMRARTSTKRTPSPPLLPFWLLAARSRLFAHARAWLRRKISIFCPYFRADKGIGTGHRNCLRWEG